MDIPCPFSPAPAEIITYELPEHLREPIASLWQKRDGMNTYTVGLGISDGERESKAQDYAKTWRREIGPIIQELEEIENELRRLVEAPTHSCVEYYADWRFRCPDHHTLRAEYLARCEKK